MVDNYPRQTYVNRWNGAQTGGKLYNRAVGRAYTALRNEFWIDYEVLKAEYLAEMIEEEQIETPSKKDRSRAYHRAERALAARHRARYHEILQMKYIEVKREYYSGRTK